MKKIVILGGGTGLSNLLAGLKNHTDHLSAVVTMADDGHSTGKLRQDFGILPPGDVRQCLTALASNESLMTKMFQYRFDKGRGITGHSLGNLLLVALEKITGSFGEAVHQASHILAIKGQVLPSTFDEIKLKAKLKDGRVVEGESKIPREGHKSPIVKLELKPQKAEANPEVIWAIQNADLVVIGPGSLFTSVIPNLLIEDITKAIVKSRAKKVFVCNIATERGETENYSVEKHIEMLVKHSHEKICDYVLINNKIISSDDNKGEFGKVKNIITKNNKIGRYKIIFDDIINEENPLYHDREKLAKTLLEL